jgi:putative salt-induced outer membrane protein YdiY
VPREELRLRFYADYVETEGETDTNQVFGESKLKVFQTDRRYLFGLTNMEYDEMENLDLRAQAFAGPGYDFIKNERTRLVGEIGAGLTGEFFDEEDDGSDETVEAGLWLNAEWTQKIFENAEFYQGLTVYPSLGKFGDYRLRSESTVKTPLGRQWAIKMSLIDDYDSDPESENVKKNDLRFISSMEYNF